MSHVTNHTACDPNHVFFVIFELGHCQSPLVSTLGYARSTSDLWDRCKVIIVKEIKLTRGKTALVDDEDFEKLNQYEWHVQYHKKTKKYYAVRTATIYGKRCNTQMHRFILGLIDPKVQGDHLDGNGLNNQRENLRVATNQQNSFNMKKRLSCSSQYKGVCWNKFHQKWHSKIMVNRKIENLGYFDDEIKAAIAYNKAAERIFGQFALLNVVPTSG